VRTKLRKKRKHDLELYPDINNTSIFMQNEVEIFNEGNKFFDDLFHEIKNAKHYIHLNFFIFNTDDIGRNLIKHLEEKLRQNVKVKILYDKLGSRNLNMKYFKQFKELGGEIEIFTPLFYKPIFINLNYRNHRKIIIIDNKISYIGGFNVGNEYLSRDDKMGIWVDSHLKITGDATVEIGKRFLCDFSYVKPLKSTKDTPLKYDFKGNHQIQLLSSGVDINEINSIESKFIQLIYNAKTYIYIQTPYLILSDCMIRALKYAALNGVKIKIMIPNKKDHPIVLSATKAYAASLIQDNIDIYLFDKSAFLHSKVFISDDIHLSIGTCNFDIRSFKYSLEMNAFIYDEELAKQMYEIFNRQLQYCTHYTKEMVQNRNILIKIKEHFAKLFSTVL